MTALPVAALEEVCPGRVFGPRHAAYDTLRLLFNGMHDHRPALICLPRRVDELQRVVRIAHEAGISTAVRGGGHNVAGSGSVDGGLVIDLRALDGVRVDPTRRIATVGGGATWAGFDDVASTYGLATTGGTFDSTGVGGLTLGGGIGHLMGRYGLACDTVMSYSLVTADGQRRVVDGTTDPELDWALRGAGHNFGVVDAFTFRLQPVSHVYGGYVAYGGQDLAAAVRRFRDLMLCAPDELTCTLLLERFGPAQGPAAVMSVAYCGNDPDYPRSLDAVLRAPDVVDWSIRRRTYVSMQMSLGRLPFGLRHHWSARCVDGLPDDLVDNLVERFRAGRWTGPFNDTVLVEPIHGVVRRVDPRHSAVPFRGARFNVTGMAIWQPPEADEEQAAWARSVAQAVAPHVVGGDGYVNYLSDAHPGDDSAPQRARRTFGDVAHDRLLRLKRRVDPDNFFRSTYDLDPARAAGG